MKFSRTLLLVAIIPVLLAANGNSVSVSWSGTGGKLLPPQVIMRDDKGTNIIRCTPVETADWQGLQGTFAVPVDLSKYRAVSFDFLQKFYPGDPATVLSIATEKGGIYTDFSAGNGNNWQHIEIPLDKRIWTGADKYGFGVAVKCNIYPYQHLNSPEKYFELANFKLLPQESGEQNRKIVIRSYRHETPPEDGDPQGNALCDGNLDKDLIWPGYGHNEPAWTFDLGTIHAVTNITLIASGDQKEQNFQNAAVFSSMDGKTFHAAGRVNKSENNDQRQTYQFSTPFAGRYVKIVPVRMRQDFPVLLAEALFFGYIPDDKELAAFSQHTYDEGRPLPSDNGENYISVQGDGISFRVCKDNGILTDLIFKGRRIAGKFFRCYKLMHQRHDIDADAYTDQVTSFETFPGGVRFSTVNPAFPEMSFDHQIIIENEALRTEFSLKPEKNCERAFLRLSYETIFDKAFRKGGYYESWGGHHLERIPASEVITEQSVDAKATLSFETAGGQNTLLHTLGAQNGRFLPPGTGVGLEAAQYFLANGLRLCAGVLNVNPDLQAQTLSTWLIVVNGTLLAAYDKYLNFNAMNDFISNIHRPQWLRDVKLMSQLGGWEGLWIGGNERGAANLGKLYEFDPICAPMLGYLGSNWGDFPLSGEITGSFGSVSTVEKLRQRVVEIRKINPQLKIGFYTWLWSAGINSEIIKKHPDWFIRKTREGNPANFFPGPNQVLNFIRNFSNDASRAEAVKAICDMVDTFDLDIWYLDGGSIYSIARNWETMEQDTPHGLMDLNAEIRENIQKKRADRAVFFNNPYTPQGDFGFLESFSDIVSNWRSGANWMYKFKLFQHRDPLHYPIYIYWIGSVHGPLEDYMVGTGMLPATHSRGDLLRDVGYVSARHEVRQLALVDAQLTPNWRFDEGTALESLAMKQGNSAVIYLKHHGKGGEEVISFDAAPFGFDADRPIYTWAVTIKDARKYACLYGEPDLRKGYETTGWIGDRVVIPQYIGANSVRNGRGEQRLSLPAERAVMLVASQTPAVIWSYRGRPAYSRLSETPALRISGSTVDNLLITSEAPGSEIAILVPDNKLPETITVNQHPVQWELFRDNGIVLAIIKLDRAGAHRVSCQFTTAPSATGNIELALEAVGRALQIAVVAPKGSIGKQMLLSIHNDGNTVWSKAVTLTASESSIYVALPEIVRDGAYEVRAGIAGNDRLASQSIQLLGLGKPTKLEALMPVPKMVSTEEKCDISRHGLTVSHLYQFYTDNNGFAETDPESLEVRVGSAPMYETYWNTFVAGMQLHGVKRYLKLEMGGNLYNYCINGVSLGVHSPRYDNPEHYIGLLFDFGSPAGFNVRTAGGFGKFNIKNRLITPWSIKEPAQHMWVLNELMTNAQKDCVAWFDLHQLGAPENWNGKLIVSAAMRIVSPNRSIYVKVLDTKDELPPGAEIGVPVSLKKVEAPKVIPVASVSALPDASQWQTIPSAGIMRDIQNRHKSDMFPINAKVAKDNTNLYFYFHSKEKPGKIFDCRQGNSGKPYFSDSVELWIEYKKSPGMALHVVVDTDGNTFQQKMTLSDKNKDKNAILVDFPGEKHLFTKNPDDWHAIIAIPLSELGIENISSGDELCFNMMRNRVESGNLVNFSLAPVFFSGTSSQVAFLGKKCHDNAH